MNLRAMLIRDEGLRLKPYLDCCGREWTKCVCEKKGKLTIGVGRNLDDVGIAESEAMAILDRDICLAVSAARGAFPWFSRLTEARQDVISAMVFNMGISKVFAFKRMILSVEAGDYDSASAEMLTSTWAEQVGTRAQRLALMMKTGEYSDHKRNT